MHEYFRQSISVDFNSYNACYKINLNYVLINKFELCAMHYRCITKVFNVHQCSSFISVIVTGSIYNDNK